MGERCWSHLSDRSVLLEESGTRRFQLDGGGGQQLQRPELHLKEFNRKWAPPVVSPTANLSFTKPSLFLVSREFDGLPVSWALSRFMKTADERNSRRAERRAEGFLWASPSPLGRAGGSVGTAPPCSRCYCGSAHTHTHTHSVKHCLTPLLSDSNRLLQPYQLWQVSQILRCDRTAHPNVRQRAVGSRCLLGGRGLRYSGNL